MSLFVRFLFERSSVPFIDVLYDFLPIFTVFALEFVPEEELSEAVLDFAVFIMALQSFERVCFSVLRSKSEKPSASPSVLVFPLSHQQQGIP